MAQSWQCKCAIHRNRATQSNHQRVAAVLEKEGIAVPDILQLKQSIYSAQVQVNPVTETIDEQEIEEIPENKPEEPIQEEIKISEPKPTISFEQQFGARLPVWFGGIALALAGFFLVKYSIENSLLSPAVRVILGGFLGGALLFGADLVRRKPDFADGIRIAQSLSGAGIAVLYVSLFAASSLYQLIPNLLGFAGLGAVTATAVILSLRYGPPIALLGLVGGFLTPALVGSSDPSAPILFIYLYFVFSGLMIVIKRQNWWMLSVPTLLGTFLWVVFWMTSSFTPADTIWLGLFLVAVSSTIVISSNRACEEGSADITDVFKLTSALNYVGLGGAMILMGVIAGKAGFGVLEWSLFGLLAVGGIGLAYFNDKLYGFVPWMSMAVNAVMLFAWKTPDASAVALTLVIFASIYAGAGYFLMWRTRLPLLWAGLAGATSIVFYLLAYFKLRHAGLVDFIPLFWGSAALVLAGTAVYALQEIRNRYHDHAHKEYLLAIFAATATAFISIGLTIELEREFLSVAFAGQMLAISWINSRIPIKALRSISMVLALVFGFLLIPQILLLVKLIAYSLVGAKLILQESIPIVQWPSFQLGVPALMFMGTSYFLRLDQDGKLVRALELAAVGLVVVMGYYLIRHAFHVDSDILVVKAGFFERGVITNILFVYGLACFFIGRRFDRIAFSWSGIGLCAMALFRIAYFDLLMHNPLWVHQKISGGLIFNSLLLLYGLPLVWAWFASKELSFVGREQWAKYCKGFMLPLLLALISLNVRYFFHGEYLDTGITTNAEVYSYSMAWLLLGIGLLLAGVIKRDKMLRYASLGIMILTVGKVFLYDASELEGLYRVLSFFGLGLSLLGLSWFYTRFVFGGHNLKVGQRHE
jgi:uncharacterized membrane protein